MMLYMPTKVYFGNNAISENTSALRELGTKAMIVTGKHSSRINGSLADVEKALEENHQSYVIFDDIEENPSVETVAKAAAIAAEEQVDFFVAIGGGSPMDASKAISVLAKNPEAIAKAEECLYASTPMASYPIAAVPTTSGTGSEVTQYAVLTLHKKKTKQSMTHKIFADIAFVDYRYLKTSSRNVMINTCTDALAHMIESYLNINSNSYNRLYAAEGLRIWGNVKMELMKDKESYTDDMYEKFMHASVLAGISIAHTGTSIPHGLSYPVTYELGVAHGRAVGYFLPGFMKNYENQEDVQTVLELLGFEDQAAFDAYLKDLIGERNIPEELWERDIKEIMGNTTKLKNYPFEMTEEILRTF